MISEYEGCVDIPGWSTMERLLGGSSGENSMRHLLEPTHSLHYHHPNGDPYSFVDDMLPHATTPLPPPPSVPPPPLNNGLPKKKRGRRKKSEMNKDDGGGGKLGRDELAAMDSKERKRHDRFNGLSEAEVSQKTLPDHLTSNLDIVIVGINPGLFAAFKGHHYAGPGNHFWKCLHMSGLVPEPLTAEDDYTLVHYGIGFTNMVARPTKGSADLTRREIKQGSQILLEKIQKYQPKVAVFNGKLIYEVFSGKKDFPFGRQSEFVEGTNTYIWVMPSSSARCAQLPRAADKVPFYLALKKFRDYLHGLISELSESEIVFSVESSKKESVPPLPPPPSSGGGGGSSEIGGGSGEVVGKKKRGRPRKGMEKSPKEKREKLEREAERVHDPTKKRRGRPKKIKPTELGAAGAPSVVSLGGTKTPPDTLETSTQHSLGGACQPQTASSVSSGYSTATSGSGVCEERRRDENGPLSPSHHSSSFTTQSDLSSEISAAISSPPLNNSSPPTNNGDGFSLLDERGKQRTSSSSATTTASSSNNNTPFSSMGGEGGGGEGYGMMLHHPYYEPTQGHGGRTAFQTSSHPLSNSNTTRGHVTNDSSGQNGGSYGSSYEVKQSLDVATKSLSGLESLVDQIPSIGEAELHSSSTLPPSLSDSLPQSTSSLLSHSSYAENTGFLPYSSYPTYSASSSSSSSPYYAHAPPDLNSLSGSGFNSLGGPTYCSPSSMFPYGSYHHGQYGSGSGGGGGYAHLTPPPYASSNPYGSYGTTSPYAHSHSHLPPPPPPNSGQRTFPPRGMDLGHMGYGSF